MKIEYDRGIYLPEIDLWLDPRRPKQRAVISHAHADHIQRHRSIIATPATGRLFEHRVRRTAALLLDYGVTKNLGDFKLTFHPAGHCLGSAQTLIEYKGERVLYTGDFKRRPGLSCQPCAVVNCDTLITECTFGQPQYKFPPRSEVQRQLYDEIDRAVLFGLQPVVLAYSLGKSQEALKMLLAGGYSVALHDSIVRIVEIYREMGVEFEGDYCPLQPDNAVGRVIILPPGARQGKRLDWITNAYTIALSGWGMNPRARNFYRTSSVLPLSDHAGFDDLERNVLESGASRIYTVFGSDHFAQHLRGLGLQADHLDHAQARRYGRTGRPAVTERRSATLNLFDLIERPALGQA